VKRDPRWLWHRHSFDPFALDDDTAQRVLDGLDAADVPPAYVGAARTLAVASGPGHPYELLGETAVAAAFAAGDTPFSQAPQQDRRRRSARRSFASPKLAAAAAVGGLALGGGLAAAATGSLPGAAQSVASEMLGQLGIHVPGPNGHAGNHPDTRSLSTNAPGQPGPDGPATPGQPAGQGSAVSGLAQTTTATGVEKGATICSSASGGQCQAGQHGTSGGAPVVTPNHGGTGTANTASDGASVAGTTKANSASGGASSAGSGNAGAHPGSTTATTSRGASSSNASANPGTATPNSASTAGAGNAAPGGG
jgi:hypothetical protein